MIEKLNLQHEYSKEDASNIFQELDVEKTGIIKAEDFIQSLKDHGNLNFSKFYNSINKELITTGDKIITILRKIKNKAFLKDDIESVNEIEWIISVITSPDLYDLEYTLIKKGKGFQEMEGALDFLTQYSQIWDQSRKVEDMLKISLLNKELSKIENMSKEMLNEIQ
jgi:hypothetical protein